VVAGRVSEELGTSLSGRGGALIPSGAIFAGGDQSAFVGGLHDARWVCAAV
jgi:hypothetical protein